MTLQHAIPLSSKGQILKTDHDTRRQERLLHHLRPDLLDLTPSGITDLLVCCSEGKELLQYSLDALARETQFAWTSQGNLPYKNIFTWKSSIITYYKTKSWSDISCLLWFSNMENKYNSLSMLSMIMCTRDTTNITGVNDAEHVVFCTFTRFSTKGLNF